MLALHADPRAALAQRSAPPVRIGVYDGPLDLLLVLVRKEGVDLRSVPVARICDAYLAAVSALEEVDVDAAGDYLVLAATLCQLKARELLPRPPGAVEDEDEEDPKERLVRRLQEYERFRLAAEDLDQRARLDRDVFARPEEPLAPEEQVIDPGTDPLGLLRLYYGLVARRAKAPPTHAVHREPFSLARTVRWLLSRLDDGQEHVLAELFIEVTDKPRRIFTFLSALEAARLRMVDLWQTMHLGAVYLVGRVRSDAADLAALEHEDRATGEGT